MSFMLGALIVVLEMGPWEEEWVSDGGPDSAKSLGRGASAIAGSGPQVQETVAATSA